jgi:hypothetical protein
METRLRMFGALLPGPVAPMQEYALYAEDEHFVILAFFGSHFLNDINNT